MKLLEIGTSGEYFKNSWFVDFVASVQVRDE